MNDMVKFSDIDLAEVQGKIEELQELKKQFEIQTRQEQELELHYSTFVTMENKGDSIIPSIKEVMTVQKLSGQLREYLKVNKVKLQDIKSLGLQLPGVAKGFQSYWLEKARKDESLVAVIESNEGIQSILNYIASEVLVSRHYMRSIKNPEAAYNVASGLALRNVRKFMHEAMSRGGRLIEQNQIKNIEQYGVRLGPDLLAQVREGTKLGLMDAFIEITTDSKNYQESERRTARMRYESNVKAIENKKGDKQ